MEDCPHCGGRLEWLAVESNPLHAVCSACGRDVWAVAHPALPAPSAEESAPVRVAVRWRAGQPSHAELLALKRLLPELRDRPITELAGQARAVATWPLGTQPLYYARGFREQAERCGLEVVWEAAEA
jgi:hypothetical protein